MATASVPLGSYTVQASGRVAGVLYTGLASINVTSSGTPTAVLLNLTVAHAVTVSVAGGLSANKTAVVAYGPGGTETLGWAATNGSTVLSLPTGSYSFLALSGSTSSGASVAAALKAANVTGPTAFSLHLSAGVPVHFQVGTPSSGGSVVGAAGANVVVSVASGGASLSGLADTNGTIGFYLPTTLTSGSGGYCLRASAFGFTSNETCGLSVVELGEMATFPLQVKEVAVSLAVQGLPAKTSVSVNITGESAGARSVHLKGGPKFTLELPPGTYGVGARAVIGNGTTVYLPPSVLSTVIPVGATNSNLTLILVPEINASGKLTVPSGVSLASVQVALASPLLNLTVTGAAYTKAFRATPTNYTATVTAEVAGEEYVNVTRISIPATGAIHPKLVLSQAGVTVNATLAQPSGKAVAIDTPVTFVNSKGLTIPATAASGIVRTVLPPGTYRVFANGTAPTAGPNGTYLTAWSTTANNSCTFAVGSTRCLVPMTGVTVTVAVHGALLPTGSTVPVPGAVRLVGPYPSTALQTVAAPNGTFSVTLLPGAYNAYATSTSGSSASAFGRFLALPATTDLVDFLLRPAWTTTVHVAVPNATGGQTGPGTFTVRNAFGTLTEFQGVNPGSSFSLLLPVGNYSVQANASGARNGVDGVAAASQKFSVSSGNAVVNLALQVPVAATVSASLAGVTKATVAPGGTATFAFSLRANGNVPVTLRPVGAPSSWTFTFSFPTVNFSSGRLTLDPGTTVSGEVQIQVPAGTDVAHAAVSVAFDLPTGKVAGSVSPAPTITLLPFYALKSGTDPTAPPRVGPLSAILPFFLTNRGNTNETVRLTVVDASRLSQLGWTTGWLVGNQTSTTSTISLSAGENESVSLVLNTTGNGALPPGSVTVQATVTNPGTAISQSVVLKVPRPTVSTTPGSLLVTGVRVQSGPSGLPSWVVPLFAFLPTLLLVVAVVSYRWWRTRRWTRR